MSGINRAEIKPGLKVYIVLKQDQRSGKLTEGMVKELTDDRGLKTDDGVPGRYWSKKS